MKLIQGDKFNGLMMTGLQLAVPWYLDMFR